jgi:hypothetical protein
MIDLLRKRLEKYAATNAVQEEQALKEILQEVALYALWRAGFFDIAGITRCQCICIGEFGWASKHCHNTALRDC